MRWLLFFLSSFYSFFAFSQIKVDKTHAYLGALHASDIRYADYVFTNTGKKKDFILRIDVPREYQSLIKTKTLLPDSSTVLRIQYNPKKLGRFSEEFDVYVGSSMEPIKISMSGDVLEMPEDASPSCPDFNQTDVVAQLSFPLKIEVIDYYTRKPIPGALVRITAHGQDIERIKVNTQGKATRKIPLGYYYFITTAEKYKTVEFDTFVNKKTDYILIEMEPYEIQMVEDPIKNDTTPEIVIHQPEIIQPIIEEVKNDSSITVIVPLDTITDDFSLREYAANNIVFLVDISGSMISKGKLNILKAAMIKMVEKLRSCDRVSLVAYSSRADVIIPSTTGDQKDEIIRKIKELKGGGTTNGEAGLLAAYEIANEFFIKDGNNQVIMATDGVFDIKGQHILQLVKKNYKKEIITSVVGIKTDTQAESSMKQVSDKGAGNFISIQSYESGEMLLLEEMKKQSKIIKVKDE